MAYIACRKCGCVVDKKAKYCLQCGTKVKNRMSLFMWIAGGVVAAALCSGIFTAKEPEPQNPTTTKAPAREKTPEEIHKEKIERQFTSASRADNTIEWDGWVKSERCWVVEAPNKDTAIIGILKKKAVVTVSNVDNEWLRIIYAPVRDMQTGKFIECNECYIQKNNITTTPPWKW